MPSASWITGATASDQLMDGVQQMKRLKDKIKKSKTIVEVLSLSLSVLLAWPNSADALEMRRAMFTKL
jgi:uncharacterized membrane protein YczE